MGGVEEGSGSHLISWVEVLKPVVFGGLGIGNWQFFLILFETALALTINMQKTAVMGVNVADSDVEAVAEMLGCKQLPPF